MTIDQVLEKNRFKIGQMFRRYGMGAKPVNLDSIREGYERHGEPFMLKVLEVLVPDNSSFEGLIQPKSATVTSALATPVDTKTLAVSNTTAKTGKGWQFFENLLNGVANLGETIGQFKRDVSATSPELDYTAEQELQAKKQTNLIYWVAGGLILLILIILLIRK